MKTSSRVSIEDAVAIFMTVKIYQVKVEGKLSNASDYTEVLWKLWSIHLVVS
jgi:hypothetical protein